MIYDVTLIHAFKYYNCCSIFSSLREVLVHFWFTVRAINCVRNIYKKIKQLIKFSSPRIIPAIILIFIFLRRTHLTSSYLSYRSLTSGVYTLQNNVTGEKYKAYCHMAEIPGCGVGGWTLVMKVNGNKVNEITTAKVLDIIIMYSNFILVCNWPKRP